MLPRGTQLLIDAMFHLGCITFVTLIAFGLYFLCGWIFR